MKPVVLMDYLVIVLYMILTLGVGFYFMKFNKDASDFFKGGNKIPWLVSGLSAFMSGFSAWTFTAASGIAYNDGIIIIFMYMSNALTFLFGYWLFAVRWRRARISSPMEYLSARFNRPTRQAFSWSTLFFDMFMVAVWLYALSEFMSIALRIPMEWVIVVSGLIILLYCLAGGLWAVVITEFVQGVVLLPFTLVLVIVVLNHFGGFSGLLNALPPQLLDVGHSEYSNWSFLISWFIMVTFGYNTRAHAQRYFSVDTEKSAKKISLLNFFLFLLGAVIWFLPPMAAKALYPDISVLWPSAAHPQEGAYAVISLTLLPHGLIGIMLAAIFSASMSNVASFYNLYAAIFTKDIFPAITRKNFDEKKLLRVGRITTLVIGVIVPVLAILMVLSRNSAFDIMITFNTIISIAYGPPALIGLVSKKAPAWSGLVYFVVAVIVGSIGWFFLGWSVPENVFYVVPLSVVIMFGGIWVNRFIKPEKEEYIQKREDLFRRLQTPINVADEVGITARIEFTIFRFLSKVTALIGVLTLVFLFFNPSEDNMTIILYSVITLGMAAMFFVFSARHHLKETISNEHD